MKRRLTALLLAFVLCFGLIGTASADVLDPDYGPQESGGGNNPEPTPEPTPSDRDNDSSDRNDSRLSIDVPSRTPGGSVTLSPRSADKGDTVTITVKPDDGYVLDSLKVTDSRGREVELKKTGDNTYTFEMPASRVKVDPLFVRSGSAKPAAPTGFTDVSASAYYAAAVDWAVGKGITNGTTATTFSPNNPCTRAQVVTFLWRAAGSPAPSGTNPFTDVQSGAYYYDAVLWAVGQNITGGTTATTFSPNAPCTRAQVVTFLYRYEKSPAVTGTNPFTDVAEGAYYYNAVLWAVERGVTSGTTATTFSPNATCTRGQIVTFLYRDMTAAAPASGGDTTASGSEEAAPSGEEAASGSDTTGGEAA